MCTHLACAPGSALVYCQHWSTASTGLLSALVYCQHWSTVSTGLLSALVYYARAHLCERTCAMCNDECVYGRMCNGARTQSFRTRSSRSERRAHLCEPIYAQTGHKSFNISKTKADIEKNVEEKLTESRM